MRAAIALPGQGLHVRHIAIEVVEALAGRSLISELDAPSSDKWPIRHAHPANAVKPFNSSRRPFTSSAVTRSRRWVLKASQV